MHLEECYPLMIDKDIFCERKNYTKSLKNGIDF